MRFLINRCCKNIAVVKLAASFADQSEQIQKFEGVSTYNLDENHLLRRINDDAKNNQEEGLGQD